MPCQHPSSPSKHQALSMSSSSSSVLGMGVKNQSKIFPGNIGNLLLSNTLWIWAHSIQVDSSTPEGKAKENKPTTWNTRNMLGLGFQISVQHGRPYLGIHQVIINCAAKKRLPYLQVRKQLNDLLWPLGIQILMRESNCFFVKHIYKKKKNWVH